MCVRTWNIMPFPSPLFSCTAVHTVLQDLLPPSSYYRFNPLLSDAVALDDARPERLQLLVDDTLRFIDKNGEQFERAADSMLRQKTASQKMQEWYTEQWRKVNSWVWPVGVVTAVAAILIIIDFISYIVL